MTSLPAAPATSRTRLSRLADAFLVGLRDGGWVRADRLSVYSTALLILEALALVALIATSRHGLDAMGRPLGADFSQVWVAGREALSGQPDAPFDLARHIAEQVKAFGATNAVYSWSYPPIFLLPAAGLAALPYPLALATWQILTLALYLAVVLRAARGTGIEPWRIAVAALAFPAVFVNLTHGQNGLLTAGFLGLGFLALDKRPWLAGLCFGLLAFKPQFALVLPIALLVEQRWRTILGAAATALALSLASLAAFGASPWTAFFATLKTTRQMLMDQGSIVGFEKMQSVYAAVRLVGGGSTLAYAIEAVVAAATLASLIWLLRSEADRRVKSAATIVATLLVAPYSLDYDLTVLAPAIALVASAGVERGLRPFEKSALAAGFFAPLVARPVATLTSIPIGVVILALLYLSILPRGLERRAPL